MSSKLVNQAALWSHFQVCVDFALERHHVIAAFSLPKSWNFRSRAFKWCMTHKDESNWWRHKKYVFGCFLGFAYAKDHLRPKVWYENDRKNIENRMVHKWKKLIFNKKKISKSPLHHLVVGPPLCMLICPSNTAFIAKIIRWNGKVMFKKHLLLRFHLLCRLVWYFSLVGVWVRSSNVYRCGKFLCQSLLLLKVW